jgi:hypothetical protein
VSADLVLAVIVAATWLAAAIVVGYTRHTQRKAPQRRGSVSPAGHHLGQKTTTTKN